MDYIKIGNLKFSRGVLFILPGILFFGIMVIYPAGYVIYLSLFTGKGTWTGTAIYRPEKLYDSILFQKFC